MLCFFLECWNVILQSFNVFLECWNVKLQSFEFASPRGPVRPVTIDSLIFVSGWFQNGRSRTRNWCSGSLQGIHTWDLQQIIFTSSQSSKNSRFFSQQYEWAYQFDGIVGENRISSYHIMAMDAGNSKFCSKSMDSPRCCSGPDAADRRRSSRTKQLAAGLC